MSSPEEQISLSTQGKIAIITLNLPHKLNALTQDLYYRLSCLMREVAKREDIYITILTGKGRYFSAYAPLLIVQHIVNINQLPILTNAQRRRRYNLPLPSPRCRHPPQHPQKLCLQQPRNNKRLLHAPKNPNHRSQRPRNRPLRSPHLLLRLHLRRPSRLPPHALHLPRSRRRRRCKPRFRPALGNQQSE